MSDNQLSTEPSVGGMLQAALSQQITKDNADAVGKMMELYERMQDRRAAQDFATALVALQGETIKVQATKAVDEKADGTCRYRFAPYEEIMAVVQPMLSRHGFAITFDTEVGEMRLTSICTLMHSGGHSVKNRFAVRYAKPPGSSDPQGDMSTKSYAKRGALCDALNITIDHDTDGSDARGEGKCITPQQAKELCNRVRDCDAVNEAKFLAFAGAATFEEIPEGKYDMLDKMLSAKEKAQ